MASHDQQLRNPRYRDWVKACIALKYLKDGIEEFVDAQTKEQQRTILQKVQKEIGKPGKTCNSCPIDQLRAYKQDRKRKSKFCQNDICERIFDLIVEDNMYKPSWSNTDSTKWCTDHWEIAKCYMDGGGYKDKVSATDTDCKGLLSVITNNMFVQKYVDTPIDKIGPKEDVFSKSKEARNTIFHLASIELQVETLNNYVDDMIQLLGDKGKLHKSKKAKQAISKLRQLKKTDLYMNTQEDLDELEKKQNEILQKLQIDQFQNTLDELSKTLKETSQSFSSRHKALKGRYNILDCALKQTQNRSDKTSATLTEKDLQQDMANVKKDLYDLKVRCDAFDETEKLYVYLDHKKAVKQELHDKYSKYLKNIPMPALLRKLDATFDEFYMELKICNDLVYEKTNNENIVKHYREIFYKNGNRVEKIYVLGDAGVGKTTWCLKLINTWLQGLTNQTTGSMHSLDEKMMLEFDFVLFVSLRHASKDVNLIEMIRKQIFHETPQLFQYMQEVINVEPDKFLVIADGLDEWIAPDDQITYTLGNDTSFPSRKNMNHCTVITTTRPWKLNEAQPSHSEIDRVVIIRGLSEHYHVRNLAERVINKLKQNVCGTSGQVENEKKVEDFEKELHKRFPIQRLKYADSVTQIPLILIIMVVKWFHHGTLESNMAGTFSFMLKSLFEHEEGYRNIKPLRLGRKQMSDGRLSDISNLEEVKRQWSTDAEKLPECVRKHPVCRQYSRLILKLAEIAFDGLFERIDKELIFSEEILLEKLSLEEVEVAVKSGILSKSDVVGICNVSKLSFLHKTVQEFLAAIHLVAHREEDTYNSFQEFIKYCSNKSRIYDMEHVLLFISGLDANLTVKVLRHVAKVEYQKLFLHLHESFFLDLVVKCIGELKGISAADSMTMVPLNSFIPNQEEHFGTLLNLLETYIDVGSIKHVMVDMRGKSVDSSSRLLHNLSSEMREFCCLTTLHLEGISPLCLCIKRNNSEKFKLQNLRYLKLSEINRKDENTRLNDFVLDFTHSRDIESVILEFISSCQIIFSGRNLKNLDLKYSEYCYVRINADLAVTSAGNKQTISAHTNYMSSLKCTKRYCSCIQNYSMSKVTKYSITEQNTWLKCTENKLCEVEVDLTKKIETVCLKRTDKTPKIQWKNVKTVVLEREVQSKSYIDINFLNGISCSQNLTSFQYNGCNQDEISDILKSIASASNLSILKIIGNETLHCQNEFQIHLQMKRCALIGSGFIIIVNVVKRKVISKFSNVEKLDSSLQITDVKSVPSNLKRECFKCENDLTEDAFLKLGKCFQYLKNLQQLELSNCLCDTFKPSAFSCLKKIENLKTLSLRNFSPEARKAISLCLPSLNVSELLLDRCFKGLIPCLTNMKMLNTLIVEISIRDGFMEFICLIKYLKQIESFKIVKPLICFIPLFEPNDNVIEEIDLSGLATLKHFSLAGMHIRSGIWQTLVNGLTKKSQLEIMEFLNAVIHDEETKQMIKSTPGFVCQEWKHVGPYTDIILKAK